MDDFIKSTFLQKEPKLGHNLQIKSIITRNEKNWLIMGFGNGYLGLGDLHDDNYIPQNCGMTYNDK